jgi:PKD repeat protein
MSPPSVCYATTGTFDVKLVAYNSGLSDSLIVTRYITVVATPSTPSITQIGTTLYCSTDSSYTSYQWYDSTMLIPGASDTFLVVTHSGNYNIQVTNKNNCSIAEGINITLGLQNFADNDVIYIYPNPAADQLIINSSSLRANETETVSILNVLGEIVFPSMRLQKRNGEDIRLDIQKLSSGIYFVEVIGEKEKWVGKFVKE